MKRVTSHPRMRLPMPAVLGVFAMLAGPVDAGVCEDFKAAIAVRHKYVEIVRKNRGDKLVSQLIEGPFQEAEAEFDKARSALIRSIQDPGVRALAGKMRTSLVPWTEATDSFEADYADLLPDHISEQLVNWFKNGRISLSQPLTDVSYRFACLPMEK